MKPVPNIPPLPYPGRGTSLQSLAGFDQDLVRALSAYLGDLARRANGSLPADGSGTMSGDLDLNFNDIINALSLTILRSATILTQGMTFGPSNATGHFIRGFSSPTNAKNIIYNATTDDADTVPSSGANRHVFQIRGVDKLTIDDDGDVSIVDKTYLQWTGDITSLTSDNHALQIGPSTGQHIAIDTNEIQSRNNGATGFLGLQLLGGNVQIGNSSSILSLTGGKVEFPAAQVASSDPNTLDDYEEGSWTPAITYTTPGDLSVAYTTQIGRYVKIGRLVFLKGVITFTPTFTTASGELRITGLPFTHISGFSDTTGSCELTDFVLDATTKWVNANITSNSAQLRFVQSHDNPQNRTAIDTSNTPTGVGISAFFSITYEATA